MNAKWKIGVVYDSSQKSKGHHGTHFAFTGLPDVEIVLADPNPDGAAARLQAIGAVRHHDDVQTMLDVEAPDVVVVCSRLPGDHSPVIRAAVERGCHVLCEKPMTDSLSEADVIAALAARRGVKVAVAHLARHAHVFRTMKRMIAHGDIGRPLAFYGRGKEDERGGGEDLTVLGTHILDIGIDLFGMPDYVFADVSVDGRPIVAGDRLATTEPIGLCAGDCVWASFRFPQGVQGVFESRKGLCTGPVRMGVTVVGTAGALAMRYDDARHLRICRASDVPEDEAHFETLELPPEDRALPPGAAPLDYAHYGPRPSRYFADNNRFAAWDLLQAIEEDRQPRSSVYDAIHVLKMIHGIYASSLTRRAVAFPLSDRSHPLRACENPTI